MIKFSRNETSMLLELTEHQIAWLENNDLSVDDEWITLREKLKTALARPQTTAELFGIDEHELHELEIAAERGDQMARLHLEFGPGWG